MVSHVFIWITEGDKVSSVHLNDSLRTKSKLTLMARSCGVPFFFSARTGQEPFIIVTGHYTKSSQAWGEGGSVALKEAILCSKV